MPNFTAAPSERIGIPPVTVDQSSAPHMRTPARSEQIEMDSYRRHLVATRLVIYG